METAGAPCNRRQHRVAVRDGLVSGNANNSAHRARGTDDDVRIIRLRIIRHEFNITEISGANGLVVKLGVACHSLEEVRKRIIVVIMRTLFLLAPHSRTQPGTHRRDFYTILANGVGPDFGISTNLISQVNAGMRVVIFDRDRQLQAEGTVTGYNATFKAGNGTQRYNVDLRGLAPQQYTNPPKVNRFGVAIY